jgi:nucleotide-binding universal stress UspA family protein
MMDTPSPSKEAGMYHRILVPLDGTRFGEHALPYAVDIAVRTGATLELVHVHHHREHEPDLARLPQYRFQRIDEVDADHDRAELTAEARYLEQRAVDIELRYPVRVVTRVVAGRTADAVVREAQEIVADLVVMATHARQGLDRMRMGHLAHELICALNVPALCIRPESDETPIVAPELHRVLIPLDGSDFSEQVLDAAAPLLMQLQVQPTLLHILSPRPMLSSGLQEKRVIANRQQALEYLMDVAARFRGRMPEPQLTALEDAQPANVIASLLSLGEFDMVAMATHGRSGLSRLLMGSVAEEVLRHVDRPVLLFRPRLAREPSANAFAEAFRIYGE